MSRFPDKLSMDENNKSGKLWHVVGLKIKIGGKEFPIVIWNTGSKHDTSETRINIEKMKIRGKIESQTDQNILWYLHHTGQI